MTRLTFDMAPVAKVAMHSRNAPAWRMTMIERFARYGTLDARPDEEQRTTPHLWLVKDSGVYLMSPGAYPAGADPYEREQARRLARAGATSAAAVPVAYSNEYDGATDDSAAIRAMDDLCGVDFSIPIPLDRVDAAINARAPQLVLLVNRANFGGCMITYPDGLTVAIGDPA